MEKDIFSKAGINFLRLKSSTGLEATFSDVGAGIYSLSYKGRQLLYVPDDLEYYSRFYFGKTVGPMAGRIKGARYAVGGREYRLDANEGANALHSSSIAIHDKRFALNLSDTYHSACAEYSLSAENLGEAYPGKLDVKVTYLLSDDSPMLLLVYEATPELDSPINLTNHAYFNLGLDDVSGVLLRLNAHRHATYDAELLPQGDVACEKEFDFSSGMEIGKWACSPLVQSCKRLQGYDHAFILDRRDFLTPAAEAKGNGITMTLYTSSDALQVFTMPKKGGGYLNFTLEEVKYPSDPKSILVKGGTTAVSRHIYAFKEE